MQENKFHLICVTRQALDTFQNTGIMGYIWQNNNFLCTDYKIEPHYLCITALPNEDHTTSGVQEVLIPHHFVAWILADQDQKTVGFS